jgi:hypothetical protein
MQLILNLCHKLNKEKKIKLLMNQIEPEQGEPEQGEPEQYEPEQGEPEQSKFQMV